MTAIDFPNSPALNDEFSASGRTWKWDGTKWQGSAKPTGFSISETPPSIASQGDMWFSSATAKTHVYYDSAWVEMVPAIAGPAGADGPSGEPGIPGEAAFSSFLLMGA